jgi:Homeobox KN domain
MEYFDFEDAANQLPPFDLDDLDSLAPNANQDDANDCFDSVFFDKSHELPIDPPQAPSAATKLKLIHDIEIEVIPAEDDPTLGYPMFRAKTPCDLCARTGLDCFLASRGVMITGCTCCISLYKDCSFTHAKLPKGFVSTFRGVPEDQPWSDFTNRHQKSLRSFEETRGRKNGARFPRDAVKILKQWLSEHSDHPYPNEREKDDLKQLTGLKRSQISNWLANARRRGKVRPPSGASSPILGAIDIPQQTQLVGGWEDLNPMDRWKASPPENEPASMTAIARAVTSTPLPGRTSSGSSHPGSKASSRKNSSEESSGFSMFRAPSASSFETRESSNSELTFESSMSNQSKRSHGSAERRRRRRAPMTQRAAAQQAKSRSARIFQCTFCTDTFPAIARPIQCRPLGAHIAFSAIE